MSLIYLYSHDGDGLGHLRRNLNIAQAATRRLQGASCLILTGSIFPGAFGTPARCDFVKIPTLAKTLSNGYESPLSTVSGDVAFSLRERMLESVVRHVPPDLLIVDKHPQGLNGELLPALHWLRKSSAKTRVILGLRDILDEPSRVEEEWRENGTTQAIHDLYDRVWMYTDQNVYPTADVYDFAPDLKIKGSSCGYVVRHMTLPEEEPQKEPTIVATVGGGRDGFSVLSESIRSVARLREGFRTLRLRLFAGPLMPDAEYNAIRHLASESGPWIKVERFSRRYMKHIRRAVAVITMGGYNSVLECVSMGKPTVIVPRERPRMEQLIRGQVFEKFGFARLVRQEKFADGDLDRCLVDILEDRWAPVSPAHLNFHGFRSILHDIGSVLN